MTRETKAQIFTNSIVDLMDQIDEWYYTKGIKPPHNATATALNGNTISNTSCYAAFGIPGSGKTTALGQVLEQLNPHVLIFTNPNLHLDQGYDPDEINCKYLVEETSPMKAFYKAVELLLKKLKRIDLLKEIEEFNRDPSKGMLSLKDRARKAEELLSQREMYDAISPFDDFWDTRELLTLALDDCAARRAEMNIIAAALDLILTSRRHFAIRILFNIQGFTHLPAPIRRLISDININQSVSSKDRYNILLGYRDNLIPNLFLAPKELKGLLIKLAGDDKWATFQFFQDGFTHNFKRVSKEKAIECIRLFNEDEKAKRQSVKAA